jgi:hypothetical protein
MISYFSNYCFSCCNVYTRLTFLLKCSFSSIGVGTPKIFSVKLPSDTSDALSLPMNLIDLMRGNTHVALSVSYYCYTLNTESVPAKVWC